MKQNLALPWSLFWSKICFVFFFFIFDIHIALTISNSQPKCVCVIRRFVSEIRICDANVRSLFDYIWKNPGLYLIWKWQTKMLDIQHCQIKPLHENRIKWNNEMCKTNWYCNSHKKLQSNLWINQHNMGLRNFLNIKRTNFANSFYYFGFDIPVFRMLFQHNNSLHFWGEQTRSIFNTGFFYTLYKSCQKSSITPSRTSLMDNGIGRFRKQQ